MFIDELFLRDNWNIFVVIFLTRKYILGKITSISITARCDGNSLIWNLGTTLSLLKILLPSLKNLDYLFLVCFNYTIQLSGDAIYVSLSSGLNQMLTEWYALFPDFKSHFECYSFVVAFVIGESHQFTKNIFLMKGQSTRQELKETPTMYTSWFTSTPACHQFDCSEVFTHPFRTVGDRFLQAAFSVPLIYGFFKYYFKFMESASTLKCHCELFDDEFRFLFRDIVPDAV